MICPKCGCENKENYCIKCGTMINDNGVIQIRSDYKSDINDQIKKVLGDKDTIFINKPRNIAAGFFGPFYLIYRHCYFEGIIMFILTFILLLFITPYMNIFSFLLFWIFHFLLYAMFTNAYYVRKIKNQLNKQGQSNLGQESIIPVAIFTVTIYLFFILYMYLK